jgi:hypothetical protein
MIWTSSFDQTETSTKCTSMYTHSPFSQFIYSLFTQEELMEADLHAIVSSNALLGLPISYRFPLLPL